MRRPVILTAALLFVFAGRSAGGRVAFADPPGDQRRAEIEDAFLDERFDEVLRLAVGEDQEPRIVLEELWRPTGGDLVAFGTPQGLLGRRLAWIRQRAAGAYPMPAAGETDGYPRLTALVLDRQRREATGAKGLPEQSPLAALRDPALEDFLRGEMKPALRGPDPDARTADEKSLAERVREVAARNLWVALASVAGLLVVAGAWLLRSRPRRTTGGGGE